MKKSAVAFEKIESTALSKLTAADLIESLQESGKLDVLHYLPEKKKYELEIEPGVVGGLTVGRLVNVLERFKGEKKKYEYEIDPLVGDRFRGRIDTDIVTRLDDMNARLGKLERG